MKLSISVPDSMANEIIGLANKTERHVSWWIQKAWVLARERLFESESNLENERKKALTDLASLRGELKADFPNTDSVALSHKAFLGH